MNPISRACSRWARYALLFVLATMGLPVSAQTSDSDRELAALISTLARRDEAGLRQVVRPDGSVAMDLEGRYQQVTLGQVGGSGEIMVGCVSSLGEANRFFGRDLETGMRFAESHAGKSDAALMEKARLHGMNVQEFLFYSNMIEQSKALPQPASATFSISIGDGAGEGFNSAAAAITPAPGNPGATLGAQRLQLFNQAASIWGAFLDSNVTTTINAQFNPLTPCASSGAVLGSAGAANINRDFPGAPFAGTWYHAALANKLSGVDQMPANPEIIATFNSGVDTGCLGAGTSFYYGFDNATPASRINLLVVLLHEFGHGLGSLSYTNPLTGAYNSGFPDAWSRLLFDGATGNTWFNISPAERAASAIGNNLFWDGANVRIASRFLSAGTVGGRVRMYAPTTFAGGSSVSHYDTSAAPDLLMEPFTNDGLPLTLDLTRQQMRDVGWYRDTTADRVPDTITNVAPSGGAVTIGANTNITWTNTGGFNRNVTIELSTDGGATFPTAIATDVANTGTRAWTVPNTPTANVRIRVREHDFVAPLGASAANFTIGGNTAPTFTPAAAIARQLGSPAGAATSVGTAADGQTAAGSLAVTQVAGGTATNISVTSITNTNGAITANVAAACNATAGTVRFRVSDGSLTATGDLAVTLQPNAAPSLGLYLPTLVPELGGTTVVPVGAPTDNGSAVSLAATTTPNSFTGTLTGNATSGNVVIANAGPVGAFTVNLVVTDNCGATGIGSFPLTVVGDVLFSNGFE